MNYQSTEYAIAKLQARMDAEVLLTREDALKCKAGNKPCGKRCIPFRQECKVESGAMKGSDALNKKNADFLYKQYGFEGASREMSKKNPRMSVNTARQYHKEMAYVMAKNIEGGGQKDMDKVNKKYDRYFGK